MRRTLSIARPLGPTVSGARREVLLTNRPACKAAKPRYVNTGVSWQDGMAGLACVDLLGARVGKVSRRDNPKAEYLALLMSMETRTAVAGWLVFCTHSQTVAHLQAYRSGKLKELCSSCCSTKTVCCRLVDRAI
jgi:hypothetical protein